MSSTCHPGHLQNRFQSICFLQSPSADGWLCLTRDGEHELCVPLCFNCHLLSSDDDEVRTPSNYRVPASISPLIFI